MTTSLFLDPSTWDLTLTADGNIAVCTDPYAIAQDVATALRTFLGECYYDTTIGVPYFEQILGKFPPLNVVKALLIQQAQDVPGCFNPQVFFTLFKNRQLTGQIQFTDAFTQATLVVQFTNITRPFILGISVLGGSDIVS